MEVHHHSHKPKNWKEYYNYIFIYQIALKNAKKRNDALLKLLRSELK